MRPSVGLVVSIGASLDLNNLKEKGQKGQKAANRITGTSRLEFSLAYSEKPGESRTLDSQPFDTTVVHRGLSGFLSFWEFPCTRASGWSSALEPP